MRYETVETFSLNFARKVSTLLNSIDLSVPGCHSENITTQGGISMINEGNFREIVSDITFNPDAYTKEEIHTAFIEMTRRYLNEMINTMNLEKAITKGFDDERAEEILEEIATSNPCIADLDETNAKEPDPKEVILNLLDYIEFDLGVHDIGGDDISDE